MLAALLFTFAGSLHFLRPEPYIRIMPPYLPWHRGLVALLIAVFPANIYMLTNPAESGAGAIPAILLWGRLPLQIVMIWWVLACTPAE